MSSNFPVTTDDQGNTITVISGVALDASKHYVRFSDGATELILFLKKVAPELIEE